MKSINKKPFAMMTIILVVLSLLITLATPCLALWVSLEELLQDYTMSDIYYLDRKPLTAEGHITYLVGKGMIDGFNIIRLPLPKKPDFILAEDYIDNSQPVYMDYDLDLYDIPNDNNYLWCEDISRDYKDKIVYHKSSSLVIPAGQNTYFLDLTALIYSLSEKYNYKGILKFTPTKTTGAMQGLQLEMHIGEISLEANGYFGNQRELHDAAAAKGFIDADVSQPPDSSYGIPQYNGASSWAVEYLNQAASLGLITERLKSGKMSDPITREEFAETAVRFYEMATGKTAGMTDKTFNDTTNPEIIKAFGLNITAGVGDGTNFEPYSRLMRQQMATMITKILRACYPNMVFDSAGQPDFKDQKLFAAYAVDPAKFMAKFKITVGDGKGSFDPAGNCTREQALIFLVKAYNFKSQYIFK